MDDIAIIADIEPLQAPVHETRSYDRERFYFVDYGHRSSDGQTGPTLQDGPEPDTSALGTGAPGRFIDDGSSYNGPEVPGSVPAGNSPIDEYEDRLHDALVAHLSLGEIAGFDDYRTGGGPLGDLFPEAGGGGNQDALNDLLGNLFGQDEGGLGDGGGGQRQRQSGPCGRSLPRHRRRGQSRRRMERLGLRR